MKPEIKQVKVKNILNLRHQVLRIGRPILTAHFEGDSLDSTMHFAAIYKSKTIGCLSLMYKTNSNFKEKKAFQLRGMAVNVDYRSQSVGKQLLNYAEQQLKLKESTLIWCNVRTSAMKFYSKHGYTQFGDTFEIPDVGPHVLMFKKI